MKNDQPAVSQERTDTVKRQLKAVGVTWYGLLKAESNYLPQIIHPEETIRAAVYGQGDTGSSMLVATNLRAIFLDCKPLFQVVDEITYDAVSGIKHTAAGFFTAITLHSKVKDYTLKFVNTTCARNFVQYIEKKRVELSMKPSV